MWKPGRQAWLQVPLPPKPSCQSYNWLSDKQRSVGIQSHEDKQMFFKLVYYLSWKLEKVCEVHIVLVNAAAVTIPKLIDICFL